MDAVFEPDANDVLNADVSGTYLPSTPVGKLNQQNLMLASIMYSLDM